VNAGILAQVRSPMPTPYGLLGSVTPVPSPGVSLHPEAVDWATRVVANGGSPVALPVLSAVSVFCHRVDAAALRPLLWRVNLLAGDSLASSLVPLFRSPTPFGTVQGNATDTAENFVSSDYVAASGLLGNGSNKRLLTGLPLNFSPARHLGAFIHTLGTTAFRTYIGAAGATLFDGLLSLQCDSPTTVWRMENTRTTAEGGSAGGTTSGVHSSGDFVLASSAGNNIFGNIVHSGMYRNTTRVGFPATASVAGAVSTGIAIFAYQLSAGTFAGHSNARIGGYSLGSHLLSDQCLAYAVIWDALLRALGRR
jgi:hypothetical protein